MIMVIKDGDKMTCDGKLGGILFYVVKLFIEIDVYYVLAKA